MIAVLRAWLVRLTLGLAATLVAWVALLILYGVGTRYLFGSSPIWLDELARYSIIGAAMMGVGAVWVEGAHMRVAVLEARVPERLRCAIIFYQWVLTVMLAGAMAFFAYNYVGQVSFFATQGLQISRSWPVATMPTGFGLLFLLALLRGPRALRQPHEEPDA